MKHVRKHRNIWISPLMKELYLKQREYRVYHPGGSLVSGKKIVGANGQGRGWVMHVVFFYPTYFYFMLIIFPSLCNMISNYTILHSDSYPISPLLLDVWIFQFYLTFSSAYNKHFYIYYSVQYLWFPTNRTQVKS